MNHSISLQAALLVLLWSSVSSANGNCPSTRGGPVQRFGTAPVGYVYPPAPTYPPAGRVVAHPAGHRVASHTTAPPAGSPSAVAQRPVSTAQVVQPAMPAAPSQPDAPTTADQISAAMDAFRLGNNHEARVLVDRLLESVPNSPDLLQFRSLIHLRTGDLKKAALDAYDAIKNGAIWNTEQVERIYGDAQRYRNDVLVLKLLADSNPQELAPHFLLAYHHLVSGELAQGQASLDRVLTIEPEEPVAIALVRLIESQAK